MRKLSTGMDSTLENWIAMSSIAFGEDSVPTNFLKAKAEKSPNGLQEEVVADEGQLIMALHFMNEEGNERLDEKPIPFE